MVTPSGFVGQFWNLKSPGFSQKLDFSSYFKNVNFKGRLRVSLSFYLLTVLHLCSCPPTQSNARFYRDWYYLIRMSYVYSLLTGKTQFHRSTKLHFSLCSVETQSLLRHLNAILWKYMEINPNLPESSKTPNTCFFKYTWFFLISYI